MKRGTPEHPKTDALCVCLHIGKAQAVGHLELLWHFAAKYAIQGDVGKWNDAQIAAQCGWEESNGDATVFIDGLVNAGWLDRCKERRLIIHDWSDHCDRSVKKTLENRGAECFRTFPETCGNGTPLPGSGKARQGTGKAQAQCAPGFLRFWEAWPRGGRKRSKGLCSRKWAAKGLEAKADEILAVLDALKASHDWTKNGGEFIPAPIVWLNQERYDCDVEDIKAAPPPNGRMTVKERRALEREQANATE